MPTTLYWNKLFTNVVKDHTSTLFPLYITYFWVYTYSVFCYSYNHGDKTSWSESAYYKDYAWAVGLIKTPVIKQDDAIQAECILLMVKMLPSFCLPLGVLLQLGMIQCCTAWDMNPALAHVLPRPHNHHSNSSVPSLLCAHAWQKEPELWLICTSSNNFESCILLSSFILKATITVFKSVIEKTVCDQHIQHTSFTLFSYMTNFPTIS